ncbi:MAG: hypothetical protein JRJ87_20530 [Deltaproteobacteria bacterium]|nr:hypothetical protein [Deltaproteobacteria bacterium]
MKLRTKTICLLLALTVLAGCRDHLLVDLFVILPLRIAAAEHKRNTNLDRICDKLTICGKFISPIRCLDQYNVYVLPDDCFDLLCNELESGCEVFVQYLYTDLCRPKCADRGYHCMGDYLHLCRDGLKVRIDCRQLCRQKAQARSPSPSCGHNNKLGHATCLCAKGSD